MNRSFQWFNLLGVGFLACLCLIQWSRNRTLNLAVGRLERTGFEQVEKLEAQSKAAEGCLADLNRFRDQVGQLHVSLLDTENRAKAAEREAAQLGGERDQLRTNLDRWQDAVAERDVRLQQVSTQLQRLAEERNETVAKFNDIATKYNAAVKDLEALTKEYNGLVQKINGATKQPKG